MFKCYLLFIAIFLPLSVLAFDFNPKNSAVLVFDMWDKHHCKSAQKRVSKLSPILNKFITKVRSKNIQIIYSPNEVSHFYENRNIGQKFSKQIDDNITLTDYESKLSWNNRLKDEPAINIAAGCDSKDSSGKPWSKQHSALTIRDNDIVSDNCPKLLRFFKSRKIKTLFYTGVHANICILARPCGMRNLKELGYQVYLVSDLTDTFSRNREKQSFSHQQRNEKVFEHIEKFIAPRIRSEKIIKN